MPSEIKRPQHQYFRRLHPIYIRPNCIPSENIRLQHYISVNRILNIPPKCMTSEENVIYLFNFLQILPELPLQCLEHPRGQVLQLSNSLNGVQVGPAG